MISKAIYKRAEAQLKEAKALGLTPIASRLEDALTETPSEEKDFTYSFGELESDIQTLLWKAAFKSSTYYGTMPDVRDVQSIIQRHAFDLISDLASISGNSLIGKTEPKLPGEKE